MADCHLELGSRPTDATLPAHIMRKLVATGLLFLLAATSACTVAAGGGVVLVAVGIGLLTSECYDYLDVTVYDANGRKTCNATVTVSKDGGSAQELTSCYYAPLGNGTWQLRATLPGFPEATSTVQVDNRKECVRHVQSAELTIGAAHTAKPIVSSPLPATPAVTSTTPTTTPAPTSAPPASSAAPPLGVFPDQSDAPH